MRMNCFDRRTLMVLSLTLSSGFSKSSAIVRPAEPALSLITLRLESFARVHSMHPTLVRRESCINKIRKIYENLLNKKIYPQVGIPNPFSGWFKFCLRRKLPAPGNKGGLFCICVESRNLT